jgi:hypothetical protein
LRTCEGDAKVKANALSCFLSLATEEGSAAVIVRSGVLPILIRLLEVSSVELEKANWQREHAGSDSQGQEAVNINTAGNTRIMAADLCTSLISYLCHYQYIQTEFVQANGVEALLRLAALLATHFEARWASDQAANVCEALALIASSGTIELKARLIVNSTEIVSLGKTLLSSPHSSVRYWVSCLLSAMASEDESGFLEEMLAQGLQHQLIDVLKNNTIISLEDLDQEGEDAAMWAASQRLDGALAKVQAAWLMLKIGASDAEGVGEGGAASLVRAGAIRPLISLLAEALDARRLLANGNRQVGRIKRRRSSEGGSGIKTRRATRSLSPSNDEVLSEEPETREMEMDGGWYELVEKQAMQGLTAQGASKVSSLQARSFGLHSNVVAACSAALSAISRKGGIDACMEVSIVLSEESWVREGRGGVVASLRTVLLRSQS